MKLSRRKIILGSVATAGALVLGYGLWPYPQRAQTRALLGHGGDGAVLATWLKLGRDNRITVVVPHSDMGQGTQTALAQMLADELDADWNLVSVVEAPAHEAFANADLARGFLTGEIDVPKVLWAPLGLAAPTLARLLNLQITGGSSAIRYTGMLGMRPAGAAAREMLRLAAAETWNVPVDQIRTNQSHVLHEASSRKAPYGDLIEAAARQSPPPAPRLKTPKEYTLMGQPVRRFDVPEKVNGSAKYGTDTRLEGLKYAAIKHSPIFGGEIETVDEAAIKGFRGVDRVVRLDGAVAVVADNTWRAMNAARALPVTFKGGASTGLSSEGIFSSFEQAVSGAPAKDDRKQGDIDAALKGATTVVERVTARLSSPTHPWSH